MGSLILELLPVAIAFAVIPVPVVAMILMLSTNRPLANAIAFLAGWVIATVIFSIALLMLIGTPDPGGGGDSVYLSVVRLALGVILLVFLAGMCFGRPAGLVETPTRFIKAVDDLEPHQSLTTGLGLFVITMKNIALLTFGLTIVLDAGVDFATGAAAWAIFILIGTSTLTAPIIVYMIAPDRAEPILTSWKDWLLRNNRVILIVVTAVLGPLLVISGLLGLLG